MRTDNLKIIQEILIKIEEQLDEKCIDWSQLNCDALNMSLPRWLRLMEMLNDERIIRGFSYSGETNNPKIDVKGLCLTLRGLAYAEASKKGNFVEKVRCQGLEKFKLIYRILRFIDLTAIKDEFNGSAFSENHFNVTRNEFLNAIEMLIDAKYVKGVELRESVD